MLCQKLKHLTEVLKRRKKLSIFFLLCRFGRRVSRAFSFNKTPSKLKRAVSGMVHGLSPFVRDPKTFDEGRVRRLASTFDLTVRAHVKVFLEFEDKN